MTADVNASRREERRGEGARDAGREQPESRPPPQQPQALISPLKSIELQVGEHVVHALQLEHTGEGLTTVLAAPDGSQSIISMPLNERQMSLVQQLLAELGPIGEGDRVPCVGFHCYLPLSRFERGDAND